jgi:hypothetical protein
VLFAGGYPDLSRLGGKLGSCARLNKPFTPGNLAETVQTALQRVSSDGPDNVVPLRRDQL